MSVVISGTGLFTPKESITNEELVESFNQYVSIFNDSIKFHLNVIEDINKYSHIPIIISQYLWEYCFWWNGENTYGN